jgi:tRNA (uracil-5-)-methyltransferase
LHGTVVRGLRECAWLKRVVYVSCNPKSLSDNLVTLCQRESKRVRGKPFVARKAQAVDLFPHTDHVEMIVLLERE